VGRTGCTGRGSSEVRPEKHLSRRKTRRTSPLKVRLHGFSVIGSWLGGFGVTVSSETATGPPDFPLTTGHGGSDLPGLTAHRILSGFSLSRVMGSLPRVQSVSTGDDCDRISLPFTELHHPISPSLISLSLSLSSLFHSHSPDFTLSLYPSHSLSVADFVYTGEKELKEEGRTKKEK